MLNFSRNFRNSTGQYKLNIYLLLQVINHIGHYTIKQRYANLTDDNVRTVRNVCCRNHA